MPADDSDLETAYSDQDYIDVDELDAASVNQVSSNEYAVHLFKDYVSTDTCNLEWIGQSSLAPSASTVYLQIYNRTLTTWQEVDSDSETAAETNFTLTASIPELDDYKDGNGIIASRVYQGVP